MSSASQRNSRKRPETGMEIANFGKCILRTKTDAEWMLNAGKFLQSGSFQLHGSLQLDFSGWTPSWSRRANQRICMQRSITRTLNRRALSLTKCQFDLLLCRPTKGGGHPVFEVSHQNHLHKGNKEGSNVIDSRSPLIAIKVRSKLGLI